MAPDEIEAVFTQRLRWAMGALQILMRTNPLRLVSAAAWAQAPKIAVQGSGPLDCAVPQRCCCLPASGRVSYFASA